MRPPNVVLILADDMGFSDLGCYGGEIRTPTLDGLGRSGVRLSQFYNTARCSPSRASLLTGLHPHQVGIGVLTHDDSPRGYPGSINDKCVTVAEVLRDNGYATCLSGKWHLASETHHVTGSWPTRRGFDQFFGTINGCGSYYQPGTLTRGEVSASTTAMTPDFFYTDAIGEEAEFFLGTHTINRPEQPFFLYVAYTAPHWPLHAPDEDIRSYDGVFGDGWDVLRERRLERLQGEGLIPRGAVLSARDPRVRPWMSAENTSWETLRMQVYAAQIDRMDKSIGRVIHVLQQTGQLENTLLIFLSDNGGCAEVIDDLKISAGSDICPRVTNTGRPVRVGNTPEIVPGPDDTYASYGPAWANVSNTPFRRYKRWVHEGGIRTPFIVHWPVGNLVQGGIVDQAFQLTDVFPTILEAVGVEYPAEYQGRPVPRAEGRTMLSALRGTAVEDVCLAWEHVGNAALRMGRWKLVREYPQPWELYDIERDLAEAFDLGSAHASVRDALATEWQRWADRVGVLPWERMIDIYRDRGLPDSAAAS